MVAAPPTGTSLGNVTYARTNPLEVAINTLDDATGTFDIAVLDFGSNNSSLLNLPGQSINGQPLRDGQRPTFAADDNRIYFISPTLRGLLYVEPSGTISGWQFQQAVFGPYAFVTGGTVASETSPEGGLELRVGPNPTRGAARVAYTTAQSGPAEVVLFDGLGRRVATLVSGDVAAGAHEARVPAGLAAGVYVVRLTAEGRTATRPLTVAR